MSRTIFQTVSVSPIPACNNSSSSSKLPLLPSRVSFFRPFRVPIKLRIRSFVVKASSSVVVDDDAIEGLERCFVNDSSSATSSSGVLYGPVMKGGQFGAFGATTLEKSKLDLTQKQTKSSPEVCLFNLLFDIGVVGLLG